MGIAAFDLSFFNRKALLAFCHQQQIISALIEGGEGAVLNGQRAVVIERMAGDLLIIKCRFDSPR